MREVDLYTELRDREAFRIEDLPESIRSRRFLAQKLHYLERTGRLRRVRRGAYLVVPPDQVGQRDESMDPYLVASVLARPYAISFHSALAMRGLADAVSQRIYVQSPKHVSPVRFGGTEFLSVQTGRLFGIETIHRGTVPVQVTDTERTLLDCLRLPQHAGGLEELLRSVEGVLRHDLLSAILDSALETGRPPARLAFRAEFEDRRAEFDRLRDHGLVHVFAGDNVYLTVLGLALCPSSKAESEMRVARNLYSFLRERYKLDQKRVSDIDAIAGSIEAAESAVQRTAAAFVGSNIGVHATIGAAQPWPSQIGATEAILDYRNLDQFLADRLSKFTPPGDLSLRKRSLASIRFDRLLEYLHLFRDKSLYAKAGFLVTLFRGQWQPPADMFRELSRNLSRRKYYFPRGLAKGSGRLVPDWNLIVPAHVHSRYVMAAIQRPEVSSGAI